MVMLDGVLVQSEVKFVLHDSVHFPVRFISRYITLLSSLLLYVFQDKIFFRFACEIDQVRSGSS